MLSIVVNDALIGIDVMKKYPAFYARMLADKELRMAFLDTLELLEESSAEVNQYGLARFPPLKSDHIFTSSGKLTHGLELHLEQIK